MIDTFSVVGWMADAMRHAAAVARWSAFRLKGAVRAIAVHGGAGREAPGDRAARRAGVLRAAEAGWTALARGDALEAVVEAVALLEDDPRFNAGLGSVL